MLQTCGAVMGSLECQMGTSRGEKDRIRLSRVARLGTMVA